MKILAIEKETPGATEEQFALHLKAEAARAWELYQAGVLRELYFNRDNHCAVLILECSDVEEARRALDSLPLVKAGRITFDIIPLAPYPGFARLFASEMLPSAR
jgi:muconolactone delta-isomerase